VRGAGRCRRMVSAGGQERIGSSVSSSSLAPKQILIKIIATSPTLFSRSIEMTIYHSNDSSAFPTLQQQL